jgi:hypothetical protein
MKSKVVRCGDTCRSIISALGRLKQKDHEFMASLDYIARSYPPKN